VNVIRGALDMTVKTVQKSMTPLDKAFMLSTDDRLDEVGGQGRRGQALHAQ
jgi:metal transporter CNNM